MPEAESDGQSLARRIVLHLALLPALGRGTVATLAYTQQGMAHSLGRPQSAFVRALQRLEEAGLVTKELRPVVGLSRPLKVYALTRVGRSFARYVRDERATRPEVQGGRPRRGRPAERA